MVSIKSLHYLISKRLKLKFDDRFVFLEFLLVATASQKILSNVAFMKKRITANVDILNK